MGLWKGNGRGKFSTLLLPVWGLNMERRAFADWCNDGDLEFEVLKDLFVCRWKKFSSSLRPFRFLLFFPTGYDGVLVSGDSHPFTRAFSLFMVASFYFSDLPVSVISRSTPLIYLIQ